jgi:hypothetical protein
MNSRTHDKAILPPRVTLTKAMLKHLNEEIMASSVAAIAKRTGLPYLLIYNVAHKRVKSLSTRNYRIIFGKSPPPQAQRKIDGTDFRQMVALWLFLNDNATKTELYWEFYGREHTRRVDYRLFTGQTRSVDPQFIRYLEKKFSECGIGPDTVLRWARELARKDQNDYVPYERVRPLLFFLKERLGINPTTVLNQWVKRYESGDLKHVSRKIFNRAHALKNKAETALASGSQLEITKIREAIYSPRPGYTLFAEVEAELAFLKKYAGQGAKRYLGRSTSMYKRGGCKRLPTWRARKIVGDCRALIRRKPHLFFRSLPRSMAQPLMDALLQVLKAHTADLLSREEGIRLEKQILKPSHASDEYKKQIYGFTQFDMAGRVLGMHKAAFDLMVAKNCEIFRRIGTYSQRWYLSDLYLKELAHKRHFDLITAKYEWLAQHRKPVRSLSTACMN